MALAIKINGVTKNAFTRYRSLRIEKHGALETCRVEFLDHNTTAAAFRPVPGDSLHVYRDTIHLEYGGEVTRVTDRRLDEGDGGGTVTLVESRGWYFEAADVRIPVLVLPAQTLQSAVEYIRARYLAGKGWINLEAFPGGPDLPLLVFLNQSVSQIFDDLTKKKGYPWRVNGDRQMAFTAPGSLVGQHTYDNTNSIVLRGATWTQERVRRATRLFVTTGGTGEHVAHVENHTANGTKTHFPVNVLPPEPTAAVNLVAGYAIGATSIALDGLPKTATVKAGDTFRFGGHGLYTVSADATTDATGAVTVSFSAGLAQAVVDDAEVTFDSGTFVRLEVGGVATALAGAPWDYDKEQAILWTSGAAPAAATVITYRAIVDFPAVVRAWTDAAQNANGTFNYAIVRDAEVSRPEIADLAQAKAQGDTELAYRTAEPKELHLATFAQDVYPWMSAACSFPERLVTGNYLIQSVILTDVGKKNQDPRVELVLLEGSSIGRDWRSYWMGTDTGAQYVAPTAAPVVLHDITVPGATGTQVITGTLGTPRAIIAFGGPTAEGTETATLRWTMGTALKQTAGTGYGNTDAHVRSEDADSSPSTRAGSSGTSLTTHIDPTTFVIMQRSAVVGMADGQFSLDWTTVTTPGHLGMLSIPTSLVTHAAYNTVVMRTTAGTTDVVCTDSLDVGTFEPDVVLFWLSGFHTSPAQVAQTGTGAVFLGVAINGGFHGCVAGGVMNTTSSVAADTYQYISDAVAVRPVNGNTGAFAFDAAVSFLSNGFRLTVATGAAGAYYLRWIAFKGSGVWKAGVAQAPTSPGTQALNVTGMYPSALMAMGISSASLDTIVSNLGIAHGAAGRNPTTQHAAWMSAVDNANPTQCDTAVRNNLLYFGTDNAPATATATADVSAWADGEITLNWSVASTAFRFLWLSCGT